MRNIILVVLAVACLTMAGCAQPAVQTIGRGAPITDELVDSIKEGVTTKAELVAKLGQPFSATRMPDGSEMLMWSYTETQQRGRTEHNVFFGSRYNVTANATMLNVTFTNNGIVNTFIKSSSTYGDQPVTVKTEPVSQP